MPEPGAPRQKGMNEFISLSLGNSNDVSQYQPLTDQELGERRWAPLRTVLMLPLRSSATHPR